jgi:hypothetical protein
MFTSIIKLDDQIVLSRKVPLRRVNDGTVALMPFVDDESSIDVDPQTIIGASAEPIGPAIEADLPRPAHREVILGNPDCGRLFSPVEVKQFVITDQNRATTQIKIVPILSLPITELGIDNLFPS